MSNILVTGSTGYIGKNLVSKLAELGHNVYAVVRKTTDISVFNSETTKSFFVFDENIDNLSKFIAEKKIDVVVHLASIFIAEHNDANVKNLVDSNILFANSILDGMRIAGVKNIINTGTYWQHYTATKEYNPVCLYAATKEALEKIIDFYVQSEGFKAITLKLYDTYGPNDSRSKITNLLKKVQYSGEELNMSGGEQLLDIVHIYDVIENFVAAIEKVMTIGKSGHDKYFVSSQRHISLKNLVYVFEKVRNCKLKINFGKRPYRKREVMVPYMPNANEILKQAKIELEEGLKSF